MRWVLVTGGAGFIGSNFVWYLLDRYGDCDVTVLDKLTYAGNPENLTRVKDDPRFRFVRGDICDARLVEEILVEHRIDTIVNFAAETHVDRSLLDAGSFITTDVYGTYVLLETSRQHRIERYVQVSTDEVYGEVNEGSSTEQDPIAPRSPYSASKGGGDLMVQAYHASYGLPTIITRGSNNYGPYQYPEKFIPLFITNAIDDHPLPLYGDGRQVRDWIFVLDHCSGIETALRRGEPGRIYNIGGGNERQNIHIARRILQLLGKSERLIQHVADRLGHDRRYSIDCTALRSLGWVPKMSFDEGLAETVAWYCEHQGWWRRLKAGEYSEYYETQYGERLGKTSG